MKKRLFCLLLAVLLIGPLLPLTAAGEEIAGYYPDLGQLVKNEERRTYMEMMVAHYLRTDKAIRRTLEAGYSAVFFFEGASDNMDDPELSDISYYRVSAVCLVLRLGEDGAPYLSYFNQFSSTLPDRPLSYGAWEIDGVGEVGPATICDGTYELFSVKHGGKYEALHLRTSETDETIPAVYMRQGGYCLSRATLINIHTRNVNHILDKAMWSAGCILIGDGDFGIFSELIQATYYSVYETFDVGQRVGTVTLDRQLLKGKLYELYENREAVDLLLAVSSHNHPEGYLMQCSNPVSWKKPERQWTLKDTELMSLPCSGEGEVRSRVLARIPEGKPVEVSGSICNLAGNTWYSVEYEGQTGYVYSGYTVRRSWFQRLRDALFG